MVSHRTGGLDKKWHQFEYSNPNENKTFPSLCFMTFDWIVIGNEI